MSRICLKGQVRTILGAFVVVNGNRTVVVLYLFTCLPTCPSDFTHGTTKLPG